MAAAITENRVVLVTGASTGIGLALVKQLRRTNFRVVATARPASLPRFAKQGLFEDARLHIRPLDVTAFDDHAAVIDEINQHWGGVDVLVNNAGISYRAVIEEMDRQGDIHQIKTNYLGAMNLTRLVLPRMRQKRRGHIVNISSVGGMMAMPAMGAYSASKFALEGASEALWYELRPWGVYVTLIQPGFVHSNAFRNVKLTEKSRASMDDPAAPYHAYYRHLVPFIERMMKLSPATPEKIAARIIKIVRRPRWQLRMPATPDAWLFYYLRRVLPRRLYHYVLYRSLPNISTWVQAAQPASRNLKK